jgi:hypothetical protein
MVEGGFTAAAARAARILPAFLFVASTNLHAQTQADAGQAAGRRPGSLKGLSIQDSRIAVISASRHPKWQ